MGFTDDVSNNAKDAVGKAKEWIGDKTNNPDLERQGENDQNVAAADKVKDGLGDAGEHVKDAAKDAGDGVRDAFDGR